MVEGAGGGPAGSAGREYAGGRCPCCRAPAGAVPLPGIDPDRLTGVTVERAPEGRGTCAWRSVLALTVERDAALAVAAADRVALFA